ncbi:MAG: response regulator [bacterium]
MSRILIVDDSGIARKFIRRCLEMSGCEDATFFDAEDGAKALEILQESPADLILTDLNMPVMEGAEFLKRVKEDPKLKDIPVLLITSAENPAMAQQLADLGAYKVLGKPISPADLFPILQELSIIEG